MGQYFKLVNKTKKEYVDPWDIGGVGKLWEWCANRQCSVFPFLFRKSDEGGGGDIQNEYRYAGRWSGDEVYLVGDYDSSELYEKATENYTNISLELVEEFNDFVGDKDLMLGINERVVDKIKPDFVVTISKREDDSGN
jgi:hypothetical protein